MKYTPPNNLNMEPYGTIWEHMISDEEKKIYIQTSHDKDKPEWIYAGDILYKIHEHEMENESFVKNLLLIYDRIITNKKIT